MSLNIATMNEFIAIATSPWFILLELVSFIAILFVFIFYYRDFIIKDIKEDKNYLVLDISRRHSEFADESELSIEEVLKYFKDTYNFDIGDESVKIINKAQEYLDRLKDHYNDAKMMLYSVELGVCKKDRAVALLNDCGGFMIMSSKELDTMFKLFSHLCEEDQSYQDELWTISNIRVEAGIIEKKLINVCLTLISECPQT